MIETSFNYLNNLVTMPLSFSVLPMEQILVNSFKGIISFTTFISHPTVKDCLGRMSTSRPQPGGFIIQSLRKHQTKNLVTRLKVNAAGIMPMRCLIRINLIKQIS